MSVKEIIEKQKMVGIKKRTTILLVITSTSAKTILINVETDN